MSMIDNNKSFGETMMNSPAKTTHFNSRIFDDLKSQSDGEASGTNSQT